MLYGDLEARQLKLSSMGPFTLKLSCSRGLGRSGSIIAKSAIYMNEMKISYSISGSVHLPFNTKVSRAQSIMIVDYLGHANIYYSHIFNCVRHMDTNLAKYMA